MAHATNDTNSTVPIFTLRRGHTPLLVSMPHVGTHLPADIAARMTGAARQLPDTDWHLEQLYDFLDELGASVIVATHSRYVIDLNRPPDDANLYPGQDTTGLCPIDTFERKAIYQADQLPDSADVQRRIDAYWMPYHAALSAELQRLCVKHGIAMLWDAHSIRSHVPRFFKGRLPDFNLGTAGGASCDPALGTRLLQEVERRIAGGAAGYRAVLNGRFQGGYITRRYGRPEHNIHAVQLELAQETYMQEAHPYDFDDARAGSVRPVLRGLIASMLGYAQHCTLPF